MSDLYIVACAKLYCGLRMAILWPTYSYIVADVQLHCGLYVLYRYIVAYPFSQVYDGGDEDVEVIAQLKGAEPLTELTSTGNKLFVTLHTSASGRHRGFLASYRQGELSGYAGLCCKVCQACYPLA